MAEKGLNLEATQKIWQELDHPDENYKNPIMEATDKIHKIINESLTDSFTGCYNRNYFERFKNEFDPSRNQNNIGLVFIDLNDLKKTNDIQGHEAGDKLIKDAVNFFKSNFRKEDIPVRIGGDEFIIICRNHKNDPNFAKNLSQKVDERRKEKSPVSFAFGVAVFDNKQDKNLNDTQKRADALMYKNKQEIKSKNQSL